MLTLTRKTGETIVIGEGPTATEITVVGVVDRGTVKLGFNSPDETPVWRVEVAAERLHDEFTEALSHFIPEEWEAGEDSMESIILDFVKAITERLALVGGSLLPDSHIEDGGAGLDDDSAALDIDRDPFYLHKDGA